MEMAMTDSNDKEFKYCFHRDNKEIFLFFPITVSNVTHNVFKWKLKKKKLGRNVKVVKLCLFFS